MSRAMAGGHTANYELTGSTESEIVESTQYVNWIVLYDNDGSKVVKGQCEKLFTRAFFLCK